MANHTQTPIDAWCALVCPRRAISNQGGVQPLRGDCTQPRTMPSGKGVADGGWWWWSERERERGRGRDKKLVRVCRRLAMARGLDRAGPPRHSPTWQPRHCTPEYKKLHPLIKSYGDVNSMSMFSKNSLRMIQGVLYHMRFWKTRYCTTRLGFSSPRTRSPFLL